jgi:hypothetical protein
MEAINLNMKTALPIIREAFNNKTLQMFHGKGPGTGCLYAGPCAIGVCVPEDRRPQLDEGSSTDIESIVDAGGQIIIPANELSDFARLQGDHDMAVVHSGSEYYDDYVKQFHATLVSFEEIYLNEGTSDAV